MSEWKPIETAPYDQRAVLAAHSKSGIIAVAWRNAVGSDRYGRYGEHDGRYWKPTHWMPLPPPPENPRHE